MLISQMLRPNERVRFNTAHYGLAPIAGLQMEDNAIAISNFILVRCNRAEWETVERGYIFKDWHSQYYTINPVFMYKPYEEPITTGAIPVTFAELARDASRIITALRLYKTGRLLEPVYTVRFVVNGLNPIFITREVGPYRSEYLAMPLDGLTYGLEASEVEDVALIYNNLTIMEQTNGTEGLRAIIEHYNLSHTPLVSNFFCVHVLLTAHEMLFDGLPKGLRIETTRYSRALEILRWGMGGGIDRSIDDFYQQHIHSLRNAIHHHALQDSNINLEEVKQFLQAPLQIGIRLLMRLYRTEVNAGLTELTRSRGWQNLGPKNLLNMCVDCHARGDPAPLREVMKLQS